MYLGIAVCCLIGIAATWLGGLQHIIGAPMIGMFLGIILANALGQAVVSKAKKGTAFCSKVVLRLGIVLAGGTLSFATIAGAGGNALPYIIISIGFAFLTACLVGKYLIKVSPNTRILVAGGTSICGGTSIATLTAVLDADENEMAYAMTAIFLFDIFATLLWPYAAMGLGLGPKKFSILAGIAINDVASVTAAGATYDALMGPAAVMPDGVTGGELAVVVKLTRVVMLVFIALSVMLWHTWDQNRKQEGAAQIDKRAAVKKIVKAFPVFILGFLGLAVINTLVDFSQIALMGTTLAAVLKKTNKFLITMALVGVGCKINLRDMFTKGIKPVLLGGCTWLAVAVVTLSYVLVLM